MTRIEASGDPIWRKRARELLMLMPADIKELVSRAASELRWSGDLTRNVIAWGEGKLFCERLGKWVALRGDHGQKTNVHNKKETIQA